MVFLENVYYIIIVAWTLFYIFNTIFSLGNGLPWESCEKGSKLDSDLEIAIIELSFVCINYQSFQTEHGPPTIATTQKLMSHLINRLHILFTELNLKAKPLLPSNLIGSKLIFHNPHFQDVLDLYSKFVILHYSNGVLKISDGIEDIGGMRWELFGYLIGAWIIVYFVVWKGLHNSGKVIENVPDINEKDPKNG